MAGVIHLHVSGVNLMLILGITLAVGAIGAWLRTGDKVRVTAATVAGIIGLIQVLGSVG